MQAPWDLSVGGEQRTPFPLTPTHSRNSGTQSSERSLDRGLGRIEGWGDDESRTRQRSSPSCGCRRGIRVRHGKELWAVGIGRTPNRARQRPGTVDIPVEPPSSTHLASITAQTVTGHFLPSLRVHIWDD